MRKEYRVLKLLFHDMESTLNDYSRAGWVLFQANHISYGCFQIILERNVNDLENSCSCQRGEAGDRR